MKKNSILDNSARGGIYDFLDNEHAPDAEKRAALIQYIRECAALYGKPEYEPEDIAYHLAGLMSTKYVMSLKSDDPVDILLGIAGDLELPKAHQTENWPNFLRLVKDLH